MTKLGFASIAALLASASPAAATVYYVNLTVGAATVAGTITTNGATGTLLSSNITDYAFIITQAGQSKSLTPSLNRALILGNGVVAGATGLTFDFTNSTILVFSDGNMTALCFAGSATNCAGTGGAIRVDDPFGPAQASVQSGNVVFATITPPAVPEPATWGMMIAGFGAVGGAMRYRRRATKVAFA
jgi:hypothetical protein